MNLSIEFYQKYKFWFIIAIFIFVIFLLWLFYGGQDHEFVGLRPLYNDSISQNVNANENINESQSQDENQEQTELDFQTVDNIKNSYIDTYLSITDDNDNDNNDFLPSVCPTPHEVKIDTPKNTTFVNNFEDLQRNYKEYVPKRKKMNNESKGEYACRCVLEEIYSRDFIKARPDFLKNPETGYNLELDGYNEDLRIAFEYQGIQHYVYPNYIHKSEEEFMYQIKKDKFKLDVCDKAGIYLITIPYNVPHNQIREYIVRRLPENT